MPHPDNPRRASQEGVDLIKRFEGLRLQSYLCPGNVWTIGYGTTAGVTRDMLIDEATAEQWLRRDLQIFEAGVAKAVNVYIKQNQFDALVSLAYNIGLGNFQRSTTLRKLNDGDDFGAADAMLLWRKAGGEVSNGLVRRRRAERELFLRPTGEPNVDLPPDVA